MDVETFKCVLKVLPYVRDYAGGGYGFYFSCIYEPTINPNFLEYLSLLPPIGKDKCFLTTNALISEFEDEGITSVVDIEMLIMTEESENTGIVNYSGGSWYPVILAEKGETEEQVITGELLTTFAELKNYDKIALGETEFIFTALCGKEFTWDDYVV